MSQTLPKATATLSKLAKAKRLYNLLDSAYWLLTETDLFDDTVVGPDVHAAIQNVKRARTATENAVRKLTSKRK